MELMGKSLEDLLTTRQEKKLSVKSVCMLAEQMLTILEQVHSKHIIHRDIKPDNFVMGLGDNAKLLYLLDFGLARKYRSSTTGLHYPMKNRKKLTGTARYASINALKGLEQSRRDDLEAVGYVLMYFLRGSLPWQGLPVKTKEDRYKKIMEKKQSTTPEELCAGFPNEFAEYINYTRKLSYEEDPDYNYMKNLFNNVMMKNNFEFDYTYDWTQCEKKNTIMSDFGLNSNNPDMGNNSILINHLQMSNLQPGVIPDLNKNDIKCGIKNSNIKENGLALDFNDGAPTLKDNLVNLRNFDSNQPNLTNDTKTLNFNNSIKTPIICKNTFNNNNICNTPNNQFNQLTHSYTNCNININMSGTAATPGINNNLTNTANYLTNNNFNTLQAQKNDTVTGVNCITNPNVNLNNYVTPVVKGGAASSMVKGIPVQIPLKKSKKEKGCCIL